MPLESLSNEDQETLRALVGKPRSARALSDLLKITPEAAAMRLVRLGHKGYVERGTKGQHGYRYHLTDKVQPHETTTPKSKPAP